MAGNLIITTVITLLLWSSCGSLAKAESLRVLDVTPSSKASEILDSMQRKNKKCRDQLNNEGQKYIRCVGSNGVYDEVYIIPDVIVFNCGAFNGCGPATAEEIAIELQIHGIIDQVIENFYDGDMYYCNSNQFICTVNSNFMGQWTKSNWIVMYHAAAQPTKLSFD